MKNSLKLTIMKIVPTDIFLSIYWGKVKNQHPGITPYVSCQNRRGQSLQGAVRICFNPENTTLDCFAALLMTECALASSRSSRRLNPGSISELFMDPGFKHSLAPGWRRWGFVIAWDINPLVLWALTMTELPYDCDKITPYLGYAKVSSFMLLIKKDISFWLWRNSSLTYGFTGLPIYLNSFL